MIKRLYELMTGTPWTTGRSCTEDFGPTIGARYAAELGRLSDAQLCVMTPQQAAAYAEAVRLNTPEIWGNFIDVHLVAIAAAVRLRRTAKATAVAAR